MKKTDQHVDARAHSILSETVSPHARSSSTHPLFSLANQTVRAAILAATLTLTGFVGSSMLSTVASAQETTGGLSGTVKDPSGASVVGASVEIFGSALIGEKKLETNKAGQYKFTNLPPGSYTVKVTAPGFETAKASDIAIGVGRYPSLDISLKVGGTGTTIEVSADSVVIEQTTTHALTNISSEEIETLPHGSSFQSLIALAPAARTEPLQNSGYQINGGANAENSYLVEGQETGNIRTGASNANVPIELIDEVQVKTSGIEAQYQGSMSGTVNVIMKKGSNTWHGDLFNYYNADGLDGGAQHGYIRYDPKSTYGTFDTPTQWYLPKQDHYINEQLGGQVGGPIIKDRLWGYLGFAPSFASERRIVNWGGSIGNQTFPYNAEKLYYNMRLDAQVTPRIRAFASWLSQYYREVGTQLPNRDSVNGMYDSSTASALTAFPAGIGDVQPNQNFNVGADINITPSIISTTRFGHFFDNYGDRGWQNGDIYYWASSGLTATDLTGASLASTSLAQAAAYKTAAYSDIYKKNADKHDQLTEDLEWFKSGWLGTHDFKVGYGLNHLSNEISYAYNGPLSVIYPGQAYQPTGSTGKANCATIGAYNLATYGVSGYTNDNGAITCQGLDGYLYVREYGTSGQGENFNHGLYAQDEWQVRHDLTLNLGIRFDKEYLPAYPSLKLSTNPINFGWTDKVGPRVGLAWNVFGKDKLKVYASYGKFYDQMKLSLAISSFGGDFWHNCYYALYTTDYSSIQPTYGSDGHYCSGSGDATFAGGTVPTTLKLISNIDYRSATDNPVSAGLKPYSQHETTLGFEYEVKPGWVVTGRWDRRRLDHIIEDVGTYDADGNENFTISNPGEGANKYIASCSGCSANIKAARSYDGLEFEVKHKLSHNLQFNASYTYSKLRGNYAGLNSTDISDGGGTRTDINDTRSFDEPYYQYTPYGKSASGPLATDRPNTFKIDGSYSHTWNHANTTRLGIFQQAYSGSPLSSYVDVLDSGAPVFVEGRGNWIDMSIDSAGRAVWGKSHALRTPAFFQTDVNFNHTIKIGDKGRAVTFEGIATNVLNQREVVSLYSKLNTTQKTAYISIPAISDTTSAYYGTPDYYTLTHGYDYKTLFNSQKLLPSNEYGKPYLYQSARTIRFRVAYRF